MFFSLIQQRFIFILFTLQFISFSFSIAIKNDFKNLISNDIKDFSDRRKDDDSSKWWKINSNKKIPTPFYGCANETFPPKNSAIKSYSLNLDLAPRARWNDLVSRHRPQLKKLITHVETLMKQVLGDRIFNFINNSLPAVAQTLPSPYYEELLGISESSGLSVSQATLYNIFYEAFTVCTSVVSQNDRGHIAHARNLDFGLFMGWDRRNHTWIVSEILRSLVVQVDWVKSGKVVFRSVSYVGFIGVITGQKPGAFSFSFDERFSLNGGFVGLLEWILFDDHNQSWVSFLPRDVLSSCPDFDCAENRLTNERLLAPVYYILSGTQRGQGVIITRYRDAYRKTRLGQPSNTQSSKNTKNLIKTSKSSENATKYTNNTKNIDIFDTKTTKLTKNDTQYSEDKSSIYSPWFLVETNYDQWRRPPFWDDRRTPARNCMEQGGRKRGADLEMLYNVLSTRPVLNKLTTFTTLMATQEGVMRTYLRECPDPCWPW